MPFSLNDRDMLIRTTVIALTIGVGVYCYTLFASQGQKSRQNAAKDKRQLNGRTSDAESLDTSEEEELPCEPPAAETHNFEREIKASKEDHDLKRNMEDQQEHTETSHKDIAETIENQVAEPTTTEENVHVATSDESTAKQGTEICKEEAHTAVDSAIEDKTDGSQKPVDEEVELEEILTTTVLVTEAMEKEIDMSEETHDRSESEKPNTVTFSQDVNAAAQESTSEKEMYTEPESRTATPGMKVTSEEKEHTSDDDAQVPEKTSGDVLQTRASEPTDVEVIEDQSEINLAGDQERTPDNPQVNDAEQHTFDTSSMDRDVPPVQNDTMLQKSTTMDKPSSDSSNEVASTLPQSLSAESESLPSEDESRAKSEDDTTPKTLQQSQTNKITSSDTVPQPKKETISSSFNSSARSFTPIHVYNESSADKETGYSFWSHPTFNIEHPAIAPGPPMPSYSSPFPQQRADKQRLSRVERIEQQRQTCPPKKKSRCQYWPACTNKNCKYSHPSKLCREGSKCTFGTRCMFLHDGDYNESSKKKQHTLHSRSSDSELTA